MGAANEALALSQTDIIFDPVSPAGGGTVAFKSIAGQTVTITVTPSDGYLVKLSDIIVQKLQDPSQAQSRQRTPGIADRLPVSGASESEVAADYTFEVPTGYAGALVNVTFTSKIDPGYYVLHNTSKGYLKVGGANVTFSTDGTFQSGNLFDKGNSIWYITSDGYLQNEYFYLNVANNQTLYLSVTPVTRWRTEDIENETKKHIKINDGTNDLYLCNDNNSITLKTSPTNYYNACPVTVEEVSWDATPVADNLKLQSPQLVTYLRAYFKQKIKYSFTNDKGEPMSSTDGKHERRVYATIAYKDGGTSVTGWEIDESGIIYNTKPSGDVVFKANYNLLPADPKVQEDHATAQTKEIEYTVQKKPLSYTPDMDYLLYSISGGDSYRYLYDDDVAEGDPVKPDGKGGTGNTSVLRDPSSDKNTQISWKISADAKGFYTFQNTSTGKYLYFDETPHASSDYGVLRLGSSSSDNSAKFRLYKTSDTNYGDCYYIIPYSKLFAVYAYNGLANGLYAALNIKDYKNQSPAVVSLFKANTDNDNSKWCIYKYEAEYRVRSDFSIKIETTNIADALGNYNFSSEGWYGKYIKESPKTGNAQNNLVINGTYKNDSNIDYLWTVKGLDPNIDISSGTLTDGTWTKTTTGNANNRKLVINVTSLPTSTVSGVIELKLSGYSAPNENVVTTNNNGKKTIAFTILGNGTLSLEEITSLSAITNSSGTYKLIANQTYSESNKPQVPIFSGILDCDGHTITDLSAPLFTTLANGTVRNVNLSGVGITNHAGPTGAIAGTANGGSRIYNVGILDGELSSSGYCGGIVGLLDGSARVINCFSFASISGGTTVAGIVGYNNYSSTMTDLRTMVVNCMFYGNITGATTMKPVYGGKVISNAGTSGINNYNYYRNGEDVTFDDNYANFDAYFCTLPADEEYLIRFEYYRSILNSNRKLCTWWVNGKSGTAPTEADVNSVGIAKWVLDPGIAPYPILKKWDKYPSVINQDKTRVWDPRTEDADGNSLTPHWVNRSEAPAYQGKQLGTISVSVNAGSKHAGSGETSVTLSSVIVMDMDTLNHDYCYAKIQLPYYNEVFGDPTADAATNWDKRYGGNYKDYVVTGWKITGVTGGTEGEFTGYAFDDNGAESADAIAPDVTSETAWEDGFNFADRFCTNKDKYAKSGRVFAQGGYYYVPDGVTGIIIEAYWGKAVYLHNNEHSIDRVNVANGDGGSGADFGTAFSPAGTLSGTFQGQTVQTTLQDAISALTLVGTDYTVYDQAIVLVGNVQVKNRSASVGDNTVANRRPFTIMSIDEDMDNEPDYCLEFQFRGSTDRPGIHPVRFDFLPVPELGLAIRAKQNAYAIGVFIPQGHFEITETSFMHTTQFEYDSKDINKVEAPVILNGGHFEQIVVRYGPKKATSYFIMGGHFRMKRFTPGYHATPDGDAPRHCVVNAIGGEFPEFYLSGIYKPDKDVNADNPHCYINGGRFGTMAGAGYEQVDGDVTFKIDHAIIERFYGGGMNGAKPVTGNIDVTINNSIVYDIFCGGPEVGKMTKNEGESRKTVTTTADNTIFNKFFGGGNGGTSYYREQKFDNDISWPNDWKVSNYFFPSFNPLNSVTGRGKQYDDDKGYHDMFEFEVFNSSNGLNANCVARTFIQWAQFGTTITGTVTNTLTNCIVEGDFYGGGNLGTVDGNVISTLTDTHVKGSVFGGGYSAEIPRFRMHDVNNVHVPTRNKAGLIDEQGYLDYVKDDGKDRYYRWTNNTNGMSKPKDTPTYWSEADGEYKCYTPISLEGLGVVNGTTTVTIDGTSQIDGNVFGGGDASKVTGNSTVNLQGDTQVNGDVFGGGNEAEVGGSATVNIQEG